MFTEAVVGVSGTSFKLTHSGTGIPGAVSYASEMHIATFVPNTQLPATTTFVALLSERVDITDNAGNALTPTAWVFTTGEDTVAPSLVGTTPMSEDTSVAVNSTITVSFDEPVANVTVTTFTVDVGGAPITGTVAPISGTTPDTTHVFTPAANLPATSGITVTLSSGIADTVGNGLPTTTFSFRTI